MTLDHTADAPTILVVGGEGVVGHALELLLQSADRSVRFLDYRSLDELKRGLADMIDPGYIADRTARRSRTE
jgi:hypothetical protein